MTKKGLMVEAIEIHRLFGVETRDREPKNPMHQGEWCECGRRKSAKRWQCFRCARGLRSTDAPARPRRIAGRGRLPALKVGA